MTTTLTFDLPHEADTSRLGRALSDQLRAGDCLLLEGPIGAGKSHLARAFIRARLGEAEDVPSPSFTLVQTYPGDPEVWHADLYRLSHPDEVLELGLEDAFATAICLIEWPDRLGTSRPANAIRLTLAVQGEGRVAMMTVQARPDLDAALRKHIAQEKRAGDAKAFLTTAGWDKASRKTLAGDASARRYERLNRDGESAVLMDAPPDQMDSVADFSRIDRHLRVLGLSAPEILAEDADAGFMLLEDLGDALFPAQIAAIPALELALYTAATDVLLEIQANAPVQGLPDLSAAAWAEAAAMAVDWYALIGDGGGRDQFVSVLAETLVRYADGSRVMILRDCHAENLIWLPDRKGLARVGLLDFQLAQMGQPGYDLVSLLQDARRTVPPEIEAAMIRRFAMARGQDLDKFSIAYAALGAQRALRILGIFAKLALTEGKTRYIPMIPHVWGQLQRNLANPALSNLREVCEKILPPPDAMHLLEARCPSP